MSAESGPGAAPGAEPDGPAATAATGPAPRHIVVAGDWHGNEGWALSVIGRVPSLLPGEPWRLILHLGDFGIWPDAAGRAYLAHVSAALAAVDAELWFVDGNHEDFPLLGRLAREGGATPDGREVIGAQLFHLPRGYRWTWHDRRWLACGGGVSLDRAQRTEGVDWWHQEEITTAQQAAVIADGPADVLASHDCPSGVAHAFGRPPSWWDPADLARNDAHRRRLQLITDAVQPAHVMHGHLHRAYQRLCDFGYGPVHVTGLDADDRLRNTAVLNAATMEWQLRWGRFRRLWRPAHMASISAGVAGGLPAHFLRDIATAPMSLWWPLSDGAVQVASGWYLGALLVLLAVPVRHQRGPGARPPVNLPGRLCVPYHTQCVMRRTRWRS